MHETPRRGLELPAAGFTPMQSTIIYAEKGILTYTLSLPFAPGEMKLLSQGGVAANVVMAEVKAEITDPPRVQTTHADRGTPERPRGEFAQRGGGCCATYRDP